MSNSSSNDDMKYPTTSRQGRQQQIYNSDGARLVVGVVPILARTKQVVLVSSRTRTNEWILPKGGWESDETQEESALREAYEESGIKGTLTRNIGTFPHTKYFPDSDIPTCEFTFFEMDVTTFCEDWPEQGERQRRLFNFEEASKLLSHKPFMHQALLKCSLRAQ
ncbi:uncharacterized protein SPPG_04404 [Spizellomyces punctatus DAOM BR117]|uniref:Nudix hydrolase domain-containing protein n=1 Tax=Spizellomyces punctatus (strain DAOM BR117) TaxID=645134 RepID=A0A0L0HF44_SPIPD|nr:uncharacterized protein SPPG_04404 [Spizellomyces punctatus DAOM BR117]KND00061.1 hypothetical protein SPPG_04404 [Spizellomyces punctatus DAOM BR117]|eukprot:XP_016608100.1 hypothetical protein SPPG_04404 [Spizellomyces punctatus DAOM BR117]